VADSAPAVASETLGVGATCVHCHGEVVTPVFDRDGEIHCCRGCVAVRATLLELGLDAYYDLRGDGPFEAARSRGGGYLEMDDPAFAAEFVTVDDAGRSSVELLVEGAHCAACIFVVERLPHLVPGVTEARLELPRGRARIRFDPRRVRVSEIAKQLDRLGYSPRPMRASEQRASRRREERRHFMRLGVAFTCFANAMLFAFALYGGWFEGMSEGTTRLFRALGLVCATIALAHPGAVFLRGGFAALRARRPHMDLPVAIALIAGTAWGALNTIRGSGEVYFESLTAVIFLLSIGRWLQFRQQQDAIDEIETLFALTPARALRITSGCAEPEDVAVEALRAGDRVRVLPGASVPVDGVVVRGESDVDVAFLTGEPLPRRHVVGDEVPAGAVNVGCDLEVEVRRTGAATRVARLVALMRDQSAARAPLVALADLAARRLVTVALLLAAATFALWAHVSLELAAEHAIALLIVTCPCALGLATPLAVEVALGRAARRGILVKSGESFERLAMPGVALLDKTGTLTLGRPRLVRLVGDTEHLALAAGLERGHPHPFATAFHDACLAAGHSPRDVARGAIVQGGGVTGSVDGREVRIGNETLLRAGRVRIGEEHGRAAATMARDGLSPVFLAIDGVSIAVAGFGDELRPESRDVVARLEALGYEVAILSGDAPEVAVRVGARLGIASRRCEGGASPERKVEAVRAARAGGRTVLMVGDGVNDAAALAAADVGIAVRGGAEASLEAAAVWLRGGTLEDLVETIAGSRRAVAVIRRNLYCALGYNAVAASLAIAGLIHPLVAAILMPLSSLSVVASSFRGRTFDDLPGDARLTNAGARRSPAGREAAIVPQLEGERAAAAART
jgi:Cu2+-exporting ATPase